MCRVSQRYRHSNRSRFRDSDERKRQTAGRAGRGVASMKSRLSAILFLQLFLASTRAQAVDHDLTVPSNANLIRDLRARWKTLPWGRDRRLFVIKEDDERIWARFFMHEPKRAKGYFQLLFSSQLAKDNRFHKNGLYEIA